MSQPLISVIVPAYNCERYVESSIRSALNQTITDLEIIVIDDASTDDTSTILSNLAIQDNRIHLLLNKKNLGVANTRNLGFKNACGQYIAMLDADDLWLPDKIAKQIALMKQKDCDFCYTSYYLINENGTAVGKPYFVPETVSFKKLIKENVIGCSTVVCKAELLKQFSMRPQYAHEDYVLWLELLKSEYRAYGVTKPLVYYRVLQGSRSNDKTKSAKNRWNIYRNFLNMNLLNASFAFLSYSINGIEKHYFR